MLVSKWGNSLAVRLSKELVQKMKLKPGDDVELKPAGRKTIEIEKRDRRAEFLAAMNQFRFELPPGYKFDRDEANER
ncbi:MAG TPA: AbrB/MazE/SpoVT family DNA-binding domain-containing protein [Roseiarcus sp.]|nr:AbrB/MazE/SpoVT family DNA-binding domain-containing protein [Roseiarcus sp.]